MTNYQILKGGYITVDTLAVAGAISTVNTFANLVNDFVRGF